MYEYLIITVLLLIIVGYFVYPRKRKWGEN